MAHLDTTIDSNYKSVIQTLFDEKNNMSLNKSVKDQYEKSKNNVIPCFEKNPVTLKSKHIINTNDLYRLSTEVTPMYIKNQNNLKNRLSSTIEASSLSTAAVGASNKIQSIVEKSFEIEPSPSGVTRIHINNYDSSNNNNPVSLNDNKMPCYSNYKPVTVEFTSNPSSFYPARLDLNSANDFFQKPKKTDNCTSPIRILNAKFDETSFNLLKDNGTQLDPSNLRKDDYNKNDNEDVPKPGVFVKNKDIRASLEKSKLIVVNVTPKVNKNNDLEDITLPNSIIAKQAFELELDNEIQINDRHLNESVAEIPYRHHLHHNHQLQSNQTPITSMLKQKVNSNENTKLMPINEEKTFRKSDANEILNIESNSYYDNITKSKPITFSENEPDQNVFNYNNNLNKLIENLDENNQKDQCLQFPTPVLDTEKKLPRTVYSNGTAESRTGFLNIEQLKEISDSDVEKAIQCIETFYDGIKVWKATTNLKKESVKNNQELRDDIYSQVNKKKNLQVKIKLPNETMSDDYEPTEPIKKRKAQRCCLCMFTFMMLLIGFGIFIYFFGFIAKYYKLF